MRQTVANVVREVATKYRLREHDLTGPCRRRSVAWPRQEAYFRVFTECGHISYPESGRRLGGRDHTTVYAGVKRHCQRIGITYAQAKTMREQSMRVPFAFAVKSYGEVMRDACAY
jgi:chromosomal replication initiation ATPase DnaA